ncbi:MAG: hypothetical protein QM581_13195 [Pseudomonas sp.]
MSADAATTLSTRTDLARTHASIRAALAGRLADTAPDPGSEPPPPRNR